MRSVLGTALAAVMAQALTESNRQVGAFRIEPEIDTTRGPEQETYSQRLEREAKAEAARIERAEEKRRRRIERNERLGGN